MKTQNNNETNENRNVYMIHNDVNLGSVQISDDVLTVISAMAALEVDGVKALQGKVTSDIISDLGAKKLSRGVRVDVSDSDVMVDLSIILELNENIIEISKKVQNKVKASIENMTGMNVANINVNVASVAAN